MLRRLSFTTALLAAVLVFSAPERAEASLDFESSMVANCIADGSDACALVQFVLRVPDQMVDGTNYFDAVVNRIGLFSSDAGQWVFDKVERIFNNSGNLYTNDGDDSNDTWSWGSPGENDLTLENNTTEQYASQPVYLNVRMSTYASDGFEALTYDANGYAALESGGDATEHFSTGGTVTPEPISMVLLGTGLAGIAGVGRKKRRLGELDDEEV